MLNMFDVREAVRRVSALRQKIEKVMNQKDGNSSAFPSPLESVLGACSAVYRLAATLRMHLYERGILKRERLPCKVISIGNITVGGTGKTPVTLYIAELLKGLGFKVGVISRGYGGGAEKKGGIVSDGATVRMKPDEAGDEPYLMGLKLKGIPVVVGKDRVRTGRLALGMFGSDVLLLDDGFQHVRLERDIDLLLLDAANPFGNGRLLPRGILREPLNQLRRADAFVLTQSEPVTTSTKALSDYQRVPPGRPVFRGTRIPDQLVGNEKGEPYPLDFLKGRKLLAFSGIARNEGFREMLAELGGDIVEFLSFPDHYCYLDEDLRSIASSGALSGAEFLITTEKDYVRIQDSQQKPSNLLILKMAISFGDDTGRLEEYIKRSLEKA
jgi:tetraacyldisaccharide 4'-kinase